VSELDRPLASAHAGPDGELSFGSRLSLAKKIALVAAVLAVVGALVSRIDFARDMHRLDVGFLSGPRGGAYFATVDELGALAAKRGGRIRNVETAGSGENARALVGSCDRAFALAQDGAELKAKGLHDLTLLGRLPKSESVFFLGKDADKRTSLASLAGAKIGIGPKGSGVSGLAHRIFGLEDLAKLGVVLEQHPVAEELALAEKGELDLAMVVIDEDAPVVAAPIREGRLQIAPLANVDVVARRIPHLRAGRIGAGQYDAVKGLPPEDRRVLRVDTLVLANDCAGRSATIDMLTLLDSRFPDFVHHNKETPNLTGLDLSPTSKGFFDSGGPELADQYLPWAVDVMPPTNWAYIVMAVSVLFNLMNVGHRFRLWRIDDARVKLETELATVFGLGATLADIQRTKIVGKFAEPAVHARVESLIRRFEALGSRSRRQSVSMLVPMGQEMAYRYQEGVINQTLAVLRTFRQRWEGTVADSARADHS
jgi:TRAP-type uncharacterized transport system substrate-binding protein